MKTTQLYLLCCCLSEGGGDAARDVAVESRASTTVAGLPVPLPPSANASPLMLPTHHYVTTALASSTNHTDLPAPTLRTYPHSACPNWSS
ncbi:unnamed protein product [Colias eurytheme]|nr:unnamed protein product [Colias eurytheme]